jgi:hypothetical protein
LSYSDGYPPGIYHRGKINEAKLFGKWNAHSRCEHFIFRRKKKGEFLHSISIPPNTLQVLLEVFMGMGVWDLATDTVITTITLVFALV